MVKMKKGKVHYSKKKGQKGRWLYPGGKKKGRKWSRVR